MSCGRPVITVDVEDWPQSTWDRNLPVTARAAENMIRLMGILNEAGVKVTLFVLGKFAECFPDVVRALSEQGHEIASHGYGHVEIFRQSREEFREDVVRSKEILEEITGVPVRGYRAPDFSILRNSLWAFDVLADSGFEFDSSVVPIRHPRYGIPDWPREPTRVHLPGQRSILEFPLATYRVFGKNWPIGGGGYFRLLPGVIARRLARRSMLSVPFVFYCHPYEFDPWEFGEIGLEIPLRVRLHQGLGRGRFEARFRRFVSEFGGRRMLDLIQQAVQYTDLELKAVAPGSGFELMSRGV
ncbi:MAG: DUF3473 domain-containing protein [Gemmatimonadetes bacterium]|nr:DUF3473 domain-containing protein [Gemmatimonadota bacterium]